jgi:hypothetical protein
MSSEDVVGMGIAVADCVARRGGDSLVGAEADIGGSRNQVPNRRAQVPVQHPEGWWTSRPEVAGDSRSDEVITRHRRRLRGIARTVEGVAQVAHHPGSHDPRVCPPRHHKPVPRRSKGPRTSSRPLTKDRHIPGTPTTGHSATHISYPPAILQQNEKLTAVHIPADRYPKVFVTTLPRLSNPRQQPVLAVLIVRFRGAPPCGVVGQSGEDAMSDRRIRPVDAQPDPCGPERWQSRARRR